MPGTRRSGVKKMPPNLASGLKRTKEQKASEEVERVRGWVKAAVENSDAFIGQSLLNPMNGVVDELVGGLLKPDEKRVVEEIFKDAVVEQLLNGASSQLLNGASSSAAQVPRSPLIVEELLVISSSMGTKLKLLEPAVLCVLAVSCSDGLETGAPAFQWVKYSDVFGQNHKKILKHGGKKVRLPDGPTPNYLRRPSIYGCVR